MMKTIHKPLCLLLVAASLCACSKSESGEQLSGGDAIRLSAGLPSASVQSKAPINSGDTFTPAVAGWESTAAASYTAAPTWKTTTSKITASTTAQAVTLAAGQVYNADRTIKTYMKAWYPQGGLNNGMVSFVGDPKYADDGTVDVLLSGEVSGSKSDRENKVLAFEHLATQLKFVVKAGTGLAEGTKLTKIELKNVEVPSGINLTTDALLSSSKSVLAVPGIDGNLVIGTAETGDAAGKPLMIVPPSGNTVTLKVTTSVTEFDDIVATIDGDDKFQAGKAYTITLTFGQKNIELSATLAEWSAGTGSGLVE
ncbi:fimbrillin family protein [uncultured Alistipes sp.]|uniref:fimbrillin family protein n=1 Tax=uncultured Alistipes sp. TaxID=538949 RepID=UPI00259B1C4C|nr:fimbrillin family protein [uncultured Alistipes sp.]